VLGIGVVGAGGKMGRQVCLAVSGQSDMQLVALVDPRLAASVLSGVESLPDTDLSAVTVVEDIDQLAASHRAAKPCDVVVDFSVAQAAVRTMRWCADNDVHAVVGTSGLSEESLSEMSVAFSSSRANCIVAPNFAIGAVLMMRVGELLAPHMEGAEIVELHHDGKLDAPSGTAIASATRLAQVRAQRGLSPWPADRTTSEPIPGSRGAAGPGGVRLHSVRLPGLVAHQEIIFGAQGQSLSIRHDAYDRSSFMPGVLLAIRAVSQRGGLTVGLDGILGLDSPSPQSEAL